MGLVIACVFFGGVSAVCDTIILAHAFRAGTLKGLVCLFIPVYAVYYALIRFEHREKPMILLGAFGGGALAEMCFERAMAQLHVLP
jgi:hypothetical protein